MLSAVLVNLERIDQADELLNKALSINPNYPLALSIKLSILLQKDEISDASQILQKLTEIQFPDIRKLIQEDFKVKYKRVKGLMEAKINDSHGNLVGYLQTSVIRVLQHQITDIFFDGWKSEFETTLDGIKYKIFQYEHTYTVSEKTWTGRTGIGISTENTDIQFLKLFLAQWIVYASHQQFILEEGDVLTVTFTILRPIT